MSNEVIFGLLKVFLYILSLENMSSFKLVNFILIFLLYGFCCWAVLFDYFLFSQHFFSQFKCFFLPLNICLLNFLFPRFYSLPSLIFKLFDSWLVLLNCLLKCLLFEVNFSKSLLILLEYEFLFFVKINEGFFQFLFFCLNLLTYKWKILFQFLNYLFFSIYLIL